MNERLMGGVHPEAPIPRVSVGQVREALGRAAIDCAQNRISRLDLDDVVRGSYELLLEQDLR